MDEKLSADSEAEPELDPKGTEFWTQASLFLKHAHFTTIHCYLQMQYGTR